LIGLASEAERDAIQRDVARIERDVDALARYAHVLGDRGDRGRALEIAVHDLGRLARELEQLREDVLYAKTVEELEALEALSKQRETDPADVRRRALLRPRVYQAEPQRVDTVRIVGTPRVLRWTSGRRLQLVPPRRRAP
jgi:hypothetical protein